MSIQELQETLREHADAVSDDALAGRAAAALRRARATRRRQALVGVAAAAVLGPLVGAALLGVNPLERSAPPVRPPEPTPSVSTAFAGRNLLDSEVVQDKAELTLTRVTDVPTQWTVSCSGVGSNVVLHVSMDGGGAGQAPCETAPPEPQIGYILDRRYSIGSHTVHVWLTRAGSTQVVSVPHSVLTAAVYQLPAPIAVVAGVDVYNREIAFGDEWLYGASRQSEPGQRRLVANHEADGRLLVQLVSADVPSQDVRLIVDGVESDAARVLDGSGYLAVLPAGRHTVALRIVGEVRPSARLGVVWRVAAP